MAKRQDKADLGTNVPFAMEAKDIPFATDGLSAPPIYVDVIRGALVIGDIAKVNLIEHRVDAHSGEPRAVHVATLILPSSQLAAWGSFFTKLAEGPEESPDAEA